MVCTTSVCEEELDWLNVVGEKTIDDGGYVSDLFTIVRKHLEEAKVNGEITEHEVGATLASSIPAILNNAINFEISEVLQERQICKVDAEIAEIAKESSRRDCVTQNECENKTKSTDSAVSLNLAQENKLACDCCNATKLANADVLLKNRQKQLYERQIEGFNDNANQKVYESQLQAWSIVFQDADLDYVTPSLEDSHINDSFNRIRSRLEWS